MTIAVVGRDSQALRPSLSPTTTLTSCLLNASLMLLFGSKQNFEEEKVFLSIVQPSSIMLIGKLLDNGYYYDL